MKHAHVANRSRGFTLVELAVGLALVFLSVGLMVKTLPMFVSSNAHRIDENNLVSIHALMDVVRLDLSQSNAGSVLENRPASLYVCAYNADNVCVPVNAQTPSTQNLAQRYCVASSSAGDLLGQNRQVNRFVMYRGRGQSFEYFQAQNDLNDFASVQQTSAQSAEPDGSVIHGILKNLCDAPFKQTPAGLRNTSWIQLNNERVLPLTAFMLCGVNNASFPDLLAGAPPMRCSPPVNQLGREGVDCRPGENGINSMMVYYSFDRRRESSSAAPAASVSPDQVFKDVVLVTFPGKPCLLR
ncbi:MAG TPA: prepilin-type N-terminal cleavage/methylation domain-containing protein [Limnobacter sp.]|nr:prepilin-type N-terminal cleavage/methylation domain-containing protein [Limnobacter sp.]